MLQDALSKYEIFVSSEPVDITQTIASKNAEFLRFAEFRSPGAWATGPIIP